MIMFVARETVLYNFMIVNISAILVFNKKLNGLLI